ncbi:hypothetical protein Acid345_2268 [Candidatus Koribacter versatilis Ellin345]|uniref:DUF2306 domain-containing protein n=1 Tax=Koribacter versatilis (strain Ellin345) TaxID=204669 RepID=Q1IPD1_KORVE|nr:DUF2306 domain-containing protein [Candidatus Koribacter versatilis]ABF41269.1 hypothetical protein Acid345_2268 [Candidatus Koribacter versatilis Ellin345]
MSRPDTLRFQGTTSPGRSGRWLQQLLWWTMLVSSVAIALYGSYYFLVRPSDAHFAHYILPLRLHIAGGIGALLIGPWQFSTKLRARALNWHRWLGRIYLLSVALGSIAGFAMALVSKEGIATHWGFGVLAVLWFFTGLRAYLTIRSRDVRAHRRWMIRNFALSLAAVSLRNYLPLMLFGFHWSFHVAFIVVAWLCWIPNLLIAEWIIQRTRPAESTLAA